MGGDYRKAIRNRGTEREVLGTRRIVVRLEPPQNREFIGLNGGRGWKGSKRSLNIGLGGWKKEEESVFFE